MSDRYRGGRMYVYYRLESAMGGYLGTALKLSSAKRTAAQIASQHNYPVLIYKAKRNALRETKGELVYRVEPRRTSPNRRRNGQAEVGELFTMMNSTSHPRIRNQYDSIVKNLVKKIQKGTYDSSKAPKIWFYLANTAAQYYTQEYRIPERTYGSYGIFSVADRKAAADRMSRQFESETKIQITPAKQNPRRTAVRRRRSSRVMHRTRRTRRY